MTKTNFEAVCATLASTLVATAIAPPLKRGGGSDLFSLFTSGTAVQVDASDPSGTERKRRKITRDTASIPSYYRRCFTGFKSLDEEVLEAGLDYGQGGVVGLAGEKVGWGLEIAYSTLASHLTAASLQDQDRNELRCRSRAYYIDTSRSFDPRRLLKVLIFQLRSRKRAEKAALSHSGGFVYARSASDVTDGNLGKDQVDVAADDEEEVEKEAMQMMDRVDVIRVFDFEGLFEAVEEVKRRLEGDDNNKEQEESDSKVQTVWTERVETAQQSTDVANQSSADIMMNVLSKQQRDSANSGDDAVGPRLSQQERSVEVRVQVEDSDNEDDEMLLSPMPTEAIEPNVEEAMDAIHPRSSQTDSSLTRGPNNPTSGHSRESRHVHDERPPTAAETLLLISSLPGVLSAPLYTAHVRAHALLVGLMRQIQRLTLAHPLCVLMLNGTVSGGSTVGLEGVEEKEQGPSAFARNGGLKPAGGKTLDWFLDLSLLVSGPGGQEVDGAGEMNGRCLVEVLHDREGRRVGRWCALDL